MFDVANRNRDGEVGEPAQRHLYRPTLCTHRNNTASSFPVAVACALSSAAGDRYLLGH